MGHTSDDESVIARKANYKTSDDESSSFSDDLAELLAPSPSPGATQCSLDVDWVGSFTKKILGEPRRCDQTWCSIFRVPETFYVDDKNSFHPQVISMGPYHYHRRKAGLQAMEQHKWRYLHALLPTDKAGRSRTFVGNLLRSIKKLERRARNCYSDNIPLDSNSFVEMLVLDGCFILELFRRASDQSTTDYRDDPIFKYKWLRPAITMDLLMLENQIPFFILQRLFEVIFCCPSGSASAPLKLRALKFFRYWHFFRTLISTDIYESTKIPKDMQAQHLLHLIHSSCTTNYTDDAHLGKGGYVRVIHCASEIKEAGIKFKRRDGALDFFDIKFENGVIEMPFLAVQGMTYTTFLNLIALEQCHADCKPFFSGYAYLMDCLINTSDDVEILCQNRILDHWLGSNEDVSTLFNKIGTHVALDTQDFYFHEIFDKINGYYARRWPRMRANLKRDYFKNPWTYVTSIAAMILLLLTFTQTFFTVFPAFAYHS